MRLPHAVLGTLIGANGLFSLFTLQTVELAVICSHRSHLTSRYSSEGQPRIGLEVIGKIFVYFDGLQATGRTPIVGTDALSTLTVIPPQGACTGDQQCESDVAARGIGGGGGDQRIEHQFGGCSGDSGVRLSGISPSPGELLNVLVTGLDPAAAALGRVRILVSGVETPVQQVIALLGGVSQIQAVLTQSFGGAYVPVTVSLDRSSSAPFLILVR